MGKCKYMTLAGISILGDGLLVEIGSRADFREIGLSKGRIDKGCLEK